MSFYNIDDIKEALRQNVDEIWFVDYFEININDLVNRFEDLIEDKQADLAFELKLVETPFTYEDR